MKQNCNEVVGHYFLAHPELNISKRSFLICFVIYFIFSIIILYFCTFSILLIFTFNIYDINDFMHSF